MTIILAIDSLATETFRGDPDYVCIDGCRLNLLTTAVAGPGSLNNQLSTALGLLKGAGFKDEKETGLEHLPSLLDCEAFLWTPSMDAVMKFNQVLGLPLHIRSLSKWEPFSPKVQEAERKFPTVHPLPLSDMTSYALTLNNILESRGVSRGMILHDPSRLMGASPDVAGRLMSTSFVMASLLQSKGWHIFFVPFDSQASEEAKNWSRYKKDTIDEFVKACLYTVVNANPFSGERQ